MYDDRRAKLSDKIKQRMLNAIETVLGPKQFDGRYHVDFDAVQIERPAPNTLRIALMRNSEEVVYWDINTFDNSTVTLGGLRGAANVHIDL